MIDGTAIVLLGTLILVAIWRARYEKGWHAGRAALIREQHQWNALGNLIEFDPERAAAKRRHPSVRPIYDWDEADS